MTGPLGDPFHDLPDGVVTLKDVVDRLPGETTRHLRKVWDAGPPEYPELHQLSARKWTTVGAQVKDWWRRNDLRERNRVSTLRGY